MRKQFILRSGYKYLFLPDNPMSGKQGYVAEHRVVMSTHLGRPLSRVEVVHHINHDMMDNRLENLQLFSSPGEHTQVAHPEIHEKQKGLTVTQKRCLVCDGCFSVTFHNKRRGTCSRACRTTLHASKLRGRPATTAMLVGLANGRGWNKGLPMTWQKRGKDHHLFKHGKYSSYNK